MNRKRMQGVYVVEFAIIGVLLFTLLFGVLEMGRLYFTVEALNEVVRRGARLAAVCSPTKPTDVDNLKQLAVFNGRGGTGPSPLIMNLNPGDLTLNYLDGLGVDRGPGFDSIRYVQVSIQGFQFRLLIPGVGGSFTLPPFRATLPSESLGYDGESGVTQC